MHRNWITYLGYVVFGYIVVTGLQLMSPAKVEIPERYVADSEQDDISDTERAIRMEKAERLKRLLSAQRYVILYIIISIPFAAP